ncbi:hypothetical protein [Flectobacillus sp. BAB-3569]|uniref:hypothetical protein n=1 Tax=Flectobacillus sp. BAB-3569 TaxID=1509483 RepID=UPI000BA300A7|nr:hypothetical protein [Flectobacillus sp. BAB-3569]PAC24717.1 hypothetical protein BWI92_26830 [Flectobacillus sp. BAB-3569]
MKKVITFGEVLMRLTTPNFARFSQSDAFNINFGGGEANVSSSLAIMGIPASHVTVFLIMTLAMLLVPPISNTVLVLSLCK